MNLPIAGDGLHEMWGLRLVIDLFLGGAGAAALLLAVVFSFAYGWAGAAYIRRAAGIFTVVAMAISLLLLLSELTQPGRALLPLLSGRFGAPIMWGTWLQLLFLLVAAIFTVFTVGWLGGADLIAKIFGIAGAILGLAIIVYHGVYLADNAARAFWSVGGIYFLFPLIALATGAAVLLISVVFARDKEPLAPVTRGLAVFMTWSAIAVLLGAALYIYQLYTGSADGRAAAFILTSGEFALATWIAVFAIGIAAIIAMFFSLRGTGDPSIGGRGAASMSLTIPLVAAALILIAGFTLRYIIVVGGQVASQLPIT